MKKLFILFTLFISIISLSITSNAESKNVKLKIDNKNIAFTKQTGIPFIENEETYVPVKKDKFFYFTKKLMQLS
jgi:hypothetical protein|nr:MAG TPA: hypothetical protein [Caudoviricetes sp.]